MKTIAKPVASAVAQLMTAPAVIVYRLASLIIGSDRAFPGLSQLFALLPGLSGQYLRRAFYSNVLKHCGDDACLCFGTIFSHATAGIGDNAYVGAYCTLGDVTLEDDVLVASHVSIMNGSEQHGTERLDIPIREQPGVFRHVTIGQGAWIGERSVVAADVGRHAIVGAGAVVTKPVPDYAIVLGVPAKILRYRTESTIDGRLDEAAELASSAGDAQGV